VRTSRALRSLGLGLIAVVAVGPDALAGVDRDAAKAATAAPAAPAERDAAQPGATPETPPPEALPIEDMEGRQEPLPKDLEGVDLEEKLGASVPLDLEFRDSTGARVRLGDLFEVGQPVILTFNYSNCPLLCSVQLGGLVETLIEMPLAAGAQFKVVTIGLDPNETPEKAAETKAAYLDRYGRATAARGWKFLVGDEASIRAVADSVGFGYRYLDDRNEYLHPSVFAVLSPSGAVTNYTYGVKFDPGELVHVLTAAAVGESVESAQKFILSCYHYVGDGIYAKRAETLMRYAGIGFAALFAVFLGRLAWRRTRLQQLQQVNEGT